MPLHRAKVATKPRFASKLVDFFLTLLAIGGSICLILIVLGIVFNISIMMFRTGSMSPTITAGSIAFVKEIPATEISVDDIVTVERGDADLPVTHRVVEILKTNDSGVVTFTMKGDANDTLDVDPYSVSTVKRVFFSVPGIAPTIQWFSSPYVLGGLTLGAAALVVWAFWPRDEEDSGLTVDLNTEGSRHSLVIPAIFLAATNIYVPVTIQETETQIIESQYLRLASKPSSAMTNLSPGESAVWTVNIWADAPSSGTIDVGLRIFPRLAKPLPWTIKVISCPIISTAEELGCTDASKTLLNTPVANIAEHKSVPLSRFTSANSYRFQILASLPTTLSTNQDIAPLQIQLSAKGMGEEISASPDQPETLTPKDPRELAETGPGQLALLLVASSICAVFGTFMLIMRRRQHRG